MLRALVAKVEMKIGVVERAIFLSESLRGIIDDLPAQLPAEDALVARLRALADDPTEDRIYQHCASVTRLYALWESFAVDALSAWLEFLQMRTAYSALPESMHNVHRTGIARILENYGKGRRFAGLSLPQVVRDFLGALDGATPFILQTEAFTQSDRNLRLDNVASMYGACDVSNIESWALKHPRFAAFRDEYLSDEDSPSKLLGEFVDFRNEASHSAVDLDDLVSSNRLIQFCRFVLMLCRVIAERIVARMIEIMLAGGDACEVGQVSEVFSAANAVVAAVTGARVSVGDELYACNSTSCFPVTISSIQLDDVDVETVDVATGTTNEIGIRFDPAVKLGTKLVRILPYRASVVQSDGSDVSVGLQS